MKKKIPNVGKNIRKYRLKKGISQDKLSKLADISHISVIKIETGGIISPSVLTVLKIAKALKVNINKLLK